MRDHLGDQGWKRYHTVAVRGKGANASIGKKEGVWCLVPENEAFQFDEMKDALAIKGAWTYEHPEHATLLMSHHRPVPLLTETCIWCGEEVSPDQIEAHEDQCIN